jgi:cAMP phosphodiesterase
MKVFILTLITTDRSQPRKYSSYRTKVTVGVYSSNESAVAKMEELHDIYRQYQLTHPHLDHITESCEIEEYELIP